MLDSEGRPKGKTVMMIVVYSANFVPKGLVKELLKQLGGLGYKFEVVVASDPELALKVRACNTKGTVPVVFTSHDADADQLRLTAPYYLIYYSKTLLFNLELQGSSESTLRLTSLTTMGDRLQKYLGLFLDNPTCID